ncbi:unnamed protein product [Lasius platythorax]|uniref:Uncharacterized protein n=1 Tax=Lasius platythorax TaxID=488582 RepID=A0AAV2NXI7_9HYME
MMTDVETVLLLFGYQKTVFLLFGCQKTVFLLFGCQKTVFLLFGCQKTVFLLFGCQKTVFLLFGCQKTVFLLFGCQKTVFLLFGCQKTVFLLFGCQKTVFLLFGCQKTVFLLFGCQKTVFLLFGCQKTVFLLFGCQKFGDGLGSDVQTISKFVANFVNSTARVFRNEFFNFIIFFEFAINLATLIRMWSFVTKSMTNRTASLVLRPSEFETKLDANPYLFMNVGHREIAEQYEHGVKNTGVAQVTLHQSREKTERHHSPVFR